MPARPRRASDGGSLARNTLIAGAVLSTVAFGAIGMAFFGSSDHADPTPYMTSGRALKIALAEPAVPDVTKRDPNAPVETPNVTIVSRKEARLDAAQREAARVAARLATSGIGTTSIVQLSAARPAPAAPLQSESRDEPQTTGSVGEISAPMKALALAPANIPEKPLDLTPPKSKSSTKAAKSIAAVLPAPAPAPVRKPWRPMSPHEKLYGPVRLASLTPADAMPDTSNPLSGPPYDRQTAVYVIRDKKVYMPDGNALEAHSGLGDMMDDPRFARVHMRGVTPPHVYDMKMRESLFHGVEAIRLTPIGGERAIYGRSGLLAHTYMLGPNGQSNGCVSFKDYSAFLSAFKSRKVNRLAVIEKLD